MNTTLRKTVNVCRIGIAHKDITVHVTADATQEQIDAAAIHQAANELFQDHDAQYQVTANVGVPTGSDRNQLLGLLQGLADLGFGSDAEINGGDAVDEVQGLMHSMIDPALYPDGPCPKVIYSPTESAFWHASGAEWVELDQATWYFLPPNIAQMCGDEEAVLVSLDQANALQNVGLEVGDASHEPRD